MTSSRFDSNHSGKSSRTNENPNNNQSDFSGEQTLNEKALSENEKSEFETLSESEQRFRIVFEHSPLGMSITGIDGSLQVNQTFCDMLGYSHQELVNKNWREISHKDDEQFTSDITADLLSGRMEKATFEKRYIHKSGEIIYAEVSTFLQRDLELNPLYFITSVKNITRRKKAEQEQFRLLNIIDNSLDEIYVFDAETLKFKHLNKCALENLGYTSEEIKFLTPYDIKPEYTEDSFRKTVGPLLSGQEKKLVFETYHRRKNGTVYPVEVHLQLDRQGDQPLFLAIINDITKRAQSDKQLNDTLKKLQFHIENTPLADIEFNNIYQIVSWSSNAEKMFGWSAVEIIGKKIGDIKWVHEADATRVAELSAKMIQGKESSNLHVNRNYHKNGEVLTCEWYNSALYDAEGNMVSVFSLVHDITKKVEAEELILKNENKFRALIENSLDGITLVDAEGIEIYHSNSAQRILGYTPEESFGKSIFKLVHPEDRKNGAELLMKVLTEQHVCTIPPVRILHIDGNYRWIEGSATNLMEEPSVQAIVINFRDITEKKKLEDELRLSEYQHCTLFEQASDGIFLTDPVGNYIDVNTAGCKMVGYSRDEILKMNIKDLVGDEGISANPIKFKELKENPQVLAERQLKCKDGSLINVEISGKMLKDGRLQGIVRDITERKKTDEQLKESEERYSAFINADIDMIFVKDEDRRYLMANKAMAAFFGKAPDELIGKTDEELAELMKIIPCKSSDIKALQANEAFTVEEQLGNRIYETTKFPLHLKGQKKGIGGIIRDITERKEADAAILEANQKMDAFFNQSLDGFFFMMLDEPIL